MTPTEFAEIGRKLYGNRWKAAMARELGRHPVTIFKWLHAEELPDHVAKHVQLLAEQQQGRTNP
jgi:hypothetical protein